MASLRHSAQLAGHAAACSYVAASPRGGGGGQHDVASCSEDGWVRLWDVRAARSVRALAPPAAAGAPPPPAAEVVCHSARDEHALYAAWAERVLAFDLRMGTVLHREPARACDGADAVVSSLGVSADGARLVAGDDDGGVSLWSARTGELEARLEGAHGAVACVACHPTHVLRALSAGLDGRVLLHDLGALARAGHGRRQAARAGGGKGGRVRPLFERELLGGSGLETPASAGPSPAAPPAQLVNPRYIHALAHDARGGRAALALGDGCVHLLDARTGGALGESGAAEGHGGGASCVGFVEGEGALPGAPPDAAALALWSAGNDRELRLWALQPPPTPPGAAAGGGGGAAGGGGGGALLRPTLRVRLPRKPNAVCALAGRAPAAFCVADVGDGALAIYELARA